MLCLLRGNNLFNDDDDIFLSDEEAVKLIETDVPPKRTKDKSKWNEVDMGSILDGFKYFL